MNKDEQAILQALRVLTAVAEGARLLSGLHNEYVSASIRAGSLDSYY